MHPALYFDIYTKELHHYGLGHPLWVADPDENFGEVRLGSVGYLEHGHFCCLFDTIETARNQKERRVPPNFTPFTIQGEPPREAKRSIPHIVTMNYMHGSSIHSFSVSGNVSTNIGPATLGAGWTFQTSSTSGAFLLLKGGAHKEWLDCTLAIQEYVKENILGWHAFVRDVLKMDLKEEDIVFVYGFVKTAVSASACFQSEKLRRGVTLTGSCPLSSLVSGALALEFQDENGGPIAVTPPKVTPESTPSTGVMELGNERVPISLNTRIGPPRLADKWDSMTDEELAESNQCIFLQYFKARRRLKLGFLPRKIIASAGPHQLPPSDPPAASPPVCSRDAVGDDDFEVISELESLDESLGVRREEECGVVDSLLDYILEHTGADVACASHADVARLLRDCEDHRDMQTTRSVMPQISKICLEDGRSGGYISSQPASHDSRLGALGNKQSSLPLRITAKEKTSCDVSQPVLKQANPPRRLYAGQTAADHYAHATARHVENSTRFPPLGLVC